MVGTGVTAGTTYLWTATTADLSYISDWSNAASLAGWPTVYLVPDPGYVSYWNISVGTPSSYPSWDYETGHVYTGTQLTPLPSPITATVTQTADDLNTVVGTGVTAGATYLWAATTADLTYISNWSNAASLAGWPAVYLVGVSGYPLYWDISVGTTSSFPSWSFEAGHVYTGTQLTLLS